MMADYPISKEAVQKTLLDLKQFLGHDPRAAGAITMALYSLEGFSPMYAVEVVHGRWVKAHGMMPPEYHWRHVCSVCDGWALQDFYGRERFSLFCPNCGAKMDAKEG